jgi:UDP-3-O-[3-hydroxymyristoyl] N-acetylglucosamine deacetylase
VGGVPIAAHVGNVADAVLATTLASGGARVELVEHVLAALAMVGVDNVLLHVDGGEVPALEGAAERWCALLESVGTTEQPAPRVHVALDRVITVRRGESWAELRPASEPRLDVTVDFPHPAIGRRRWAGTLADARAELAWARTFGFAEDAPRLARLARGVSLDNTLVFDDTGAVNPGSLPPGDEAARHKALDAIGDLALLGATLDAELVAFRPGHALHHALLHALAARAPL